MKKHHFILIPTLIFCILVFTISASSSVIDDLLLTSELSLWDPHGDDGLTRSPTRSLLSISPEHSTALIAGLDGTVHLVESNSKRVIWSFESGTPIYTSYQAASGQDNDKENASDPSGRFFIDCGDDWDLYMHSEHFGKMKLSMSIDEFVKNTPYISEDGAVTLGSKKTTVFEVDLRTGKLIRAYAFDSPSTLQSVSYDKTSNKELVKSGPKNLNVVDLRLYITRTDYLLTSSVPNSEKTSWNMTIAEVGASLLCLDASSGAPMNLPDKLVSEIGIDFAIPLSCHTKALFFAIEIMFCLNHPGLKYSQGCLLKI
ncbi:serine/threonine-protein kinase/endoribonuclease ire1b [Quercus suber]|uniref:Serine/threonine-protein kinase/endoribonuclease ire1b n=1 Tax=Quercus suber TaxID=58331 RepID=A0AAW0LX47_QUESU